MTAAEQARAFAAMALCGVCAGAAHDLLAVLRRGPLLTAIADLMLGVIAALGMIAVGLVLCCSPFRLYAFVGVVAGWALYGVSLGTIVRILGRRFMVLSKKVVN